jgi:hypothetical protein
MTDIERLAEAVLEAPYYERCLPGVGYKWCCGFCGEPSPDHEDDCVVHLANKVLGYEQPR